MRFLWKPLLYFVTILTFSIPLLSCHSSDPGAKKEVVPTKDPLSLMSMKEKIGQLVMIGVDGYTLSDKDKSLISGKNVGGVILLGENVQDTEQLLQLNNQIKEANKNDVPLFISVDEEGGIVSRMPPGIKNLPNSKVIGDHNNVNVANKVGSAIGERVKAFGFNMVNAPVMDINSNPKNPVIGVRSFGNNKDIVSKMGIAEMKSIQSEGIVSVIKHFPGHGDTSVDSHKGLPVVYNNLDTLKERELVPFKNATKQGTR